MKIIFFVSGTPRPGGSKTIGRTASGELFLRDAGGKGNAIWRRAVREAARHAMDGRPVLTGPLSLAVHFWLPRPKSHFGTGKHACRLKPGAPVSHVIAPDATKLLRSTEDALTGIVWVDDSQVVTQLATKNYQTTLTSVGATIEVFSWRS